MEEQVRNALKLIRPSLQAHGGDVSVIEVNEKEGKVYVELQGACQGCKDSLVTLKMGIEKILKENVAGVQEVIAINI